MPLLFVFGGRRTTPRARAPAKIQLYHTQPYFVKENLHKNLHKFFPKYLSILPIAICGGYAIL
jgi:hypothetical protein